jgi:hypothetical protein
MYVLLLQSLNYAPIAVGVVLLVSGGWWVCGAHKWFDGPRRNVDEAEDPSPAGLQDDLAASSKDTANVKGSLKALRSIRSKVSDQDAL